MVNQLYDLFLGVQSPQAPAEARAAVHPNVRLAILRMVPLYFAAMRDES